MVLSQVRDEILPQAEEFKPLGGLVHEDWARDHRADRCGICLGSTVLVCRGQSEDKALDVSGDLPS